MSCNYPKSLPAGKTKLPKVKQTLAVQDFYLKSIYDTVNSLRSNLYLLSSKNDGLERSMKKLQEGLDGLGVGMAFLGLIGFASLIMNIYLISHLHN